MIRAVLDTNIFISALLGRQLGVLIDHWRADRFALIVSDEIVREYVEVLRRPKIGFTAQQVDAIAAFLLLRAEFVSPTQSIGVIMADPTIICFWRRLSRATPSSSSVAIITC